ncbi:MAG: carboxypeptidase regulatory-like domain-containing protein [Terriglobales bacterium]
MWMKYVSGRQLQMAILTTAMLAGLTATTVAQSTIATGCITGVVTDPSGGAASGVDVILTNAGSGYTLSATTTGTGLYSSGPLFPGSYTVKLEVKGFASVKFPVTVNVGTTTSGDIRLQPVGDKKPYSAGQLNFSEATVQGVVKSQDWRELPLNGRNFLDLAQLEPGVQVLDAAPLDPVKSGFFAVSIEGGSGRTTRTLLDGIDITDTKLGSTNQNVSLSSIQEFQIAQSALDISSPTTASGTVNTITRSGTNSYHGGGFYGFRDNNLGSAAFPGGHDSYFQRNQFGGNIGGAIINDKLFFFVAAERAKQDFRAVPNLDYPFNGLGASYSVPFRDNTALGRLDWVGQNMRAFYRGTYDEDSAVGPGNNYSPFLSHDNTPGQALGADFYRGSFTHSIRFGYSRFSNHLGSISEPGLFSFSPSINIRNASVETGPNPLAPQSTIQSSLQFRYDGSKIRNSHIFRFGVSFDRIATGGYEALGSLGPTVTGTATFANEQAIIGNPGAYAPALVASDPAGPLDNPLNYPVSSITISNGQEFFTEKSAFGYPKGGLIDNRLELYAGEAWRVRKNLTINYGSHYLRDGGLINSDLAAIPALNGFGATLGNAVHQPNLNFSPELGIVWAPMNSPTTVLRAGIGLYYDSNLSGNIMADRALRLQQGHYYAQQTICGPGSYSVAVPGGATVTTSDGLSIASQICGHPLSAVINGVSVAKAITDLQSAVESASATAGPNGFYAGSTGSTLGSMLSPNYVSPRSVEMNFGLQHQFGRATVLSIDYVRNSGTHFLMGVDRNHVGDISNFNLSNALAAINRTLAANAPSCGQVNASTSVAGVDCYLGHVRGASISDFAVQGLDSSGALANSAAAFPGDNPGLGQGIFFEPIGNSRYRAVDVSLNSTINHPVREFESMNLLVAYSWSKLQSSVASGNGVTGPNGLPYAFDWNNPNGYFGPSGQDRTHQLTFGPVLGFKHRLLLSILGHIDSPLAQTVFLPQSNGGGSPGEIFRSDVTGDGTVGDVLPGSNIGGFRSGASVTGLDTAINSYNANIAGHATPAGNTLIRNGLFTQMQLLQLGAVTPALATVPANNEPGWLKTVDVRIARPFTFKERFTVEPSVSVFNIFNSANFDSSMNAASGILQAASAFPGNGGSGLGCGNTCQSANRVGPGSGVFSLGSARQFEFGVRLTF